MPIGVGVLGFAHGHVAAYLTQWRANAEHGVTPLAGWDHDEGRLKASCEAFGLKPCTEVDELLGLDGLDAVVVSAETSMHAELVERAAAAKKAVIVQKPLALTMPEADRIVAAVAEHGIPFTMAWQMRTDPQNIKMKELVTTGALGQVFMVRRRHGLPMCLDPGFATAWHVDPKYNRDIFADDASHPIDMIQWMLGVPESVTAEIMSLYNPAMPSDNGIALFRYRGGPLVEVVCSFTQSAGENTTEIIAEKGVVIQNYGDGPSCGAPRAEGAVGLKWFLRETGDWIDSGIPSPPGHGDRIHGLSGPLAAFLRGDGPPVCTAEEGRTSLRMLLACYVSTREGRRVTLDDPAIDAV
jgi:predicted dehydrogenase